MSESRSAICLVIDRLSAAYVGALGNTWIRTPAFDRLASQSLVFDRAMIDSPALEQVYRSFWTGQPAWCVVSRNEALSEPSLPEWCRKRILPTVLLTDDTETAAHRLSAVFDEVICLEQEEERKQADDWQETQLAAFFAAAVELLDTRRPPALVWLHTGALGSIWDSPQALRDQYAAEDDPHAPALIEPPSLVIEKDTDPDVLLGLRHAYAGEVTVLDRCLSTLLDTIDGGAWRDALLTVTSCRGYPLGEHGIVGRAREALYGELVQAAWFARMPGGPRFGARSQSLVQPADLCAALRDWLAPDESSATPAARSSFAGRSLLRLDEETGPGRKVALARSSSGEMALATPAWFVRAPARCQHEQSDLLSTPSASDAAARQLELFVKPDDYFEANEISDRCLEVTEEFRDVVQAFDLACEQGIVPEFTLSDAAVQGIEARSAD